MDGGEAAPNESTFQWNALLYRYHGASPDEHREGTVPLPRGVGSIVGKDTGRRFLFRPGEFTVRQADLDRYPTFEEMLVGKGARRWTKADYTTYGWEYPAKTHSPKIAEILTAKFEDRQSLADMGLREAGLVRYVVDEFRTGEARVRDFPRFIEGLRGDVGSLGEPLQIDPEIVLAGESGSYGPAEPPQRVGETPVPTVPEHLGRGIRVGVVDTGIWKDHQLLRDPPHGCESRSPQDDEVLDQDGLGDLDYEAGHGTFIAGIIRQYAPAATIVCRGTLDSMGLIDDATLGGTLFSLLGERLDILNISIFGYTYASEPTGLPTTIAALRALRAENPRLVVLGAGGNHNRAEPGYPAAWPEVIGVGALDRNFSKALFSNYGDWLNVWAPGVRLLSSYVGEDVNQPGGGTTDSWARWSGTSFATPVVAGKIAAAMTQPSADA